ncbi:uncharacterized protein LOC112565011 isoform X1 [Pomacea canaliculata]|uniref:uncharacterized protein LOC112565011 isoform X1 n=1 Tax=Pomacea canaliculata TaxID=400727 RepID=UPI000D73C42F|nr:uncharacterized protein LOC112565011 isoform X1 [Pomacea canaliculata]XP_025096002.1 uncharacterized protein LOC112565011 isoform X1 [Pomacea canaliculata]
MSPAWLSLTLVLVLVPSLTFSYPSDYSELQMRERDGELSAPSQKDNKLFLRALLDHLVLASRQRTLQSPDYQASAIRDFNDPSYISDTFNNDEDSMAKRGPGGINENRAHCLGTTRCG